MCVAVENAHSHEGSPRETLPQGDLWLGEGLPYFPEFLGEASGPEKSVTPLRTPSPVQMTLLATGCLLQEDARSLKRQRPATQRERLAPSHTLGRVWEGEEGGRSEKG